MYNTRNVNIVSKILIVLIGMIFTMCNCVMAQPNQKLNVYSQSYIAYDRITKNVILGKNINKKVPMASTTKVMTAILTLEYGKLNEYVTVTQNAENTTGWQLNLKKDDKILLNDLLYAIMLYSANDGAIAIAEHISGSVEEFCKIMNDKAREIGALNTNFTSPHGLDNDMHYSTPYDLAIIMDYALNIKGFKDIISTPSYTININGYSRVLSNTNKLIRTLSGCVGGKTGYTGKAQYCLVNNCKSANMDVVAVVLGAGTSNQRFDETNNILKYVIENYEIVSLNTYIKKSISIPINKYKYKDIDVVPNQNISIPILKNEIANIRVEYDVQSNISAPVEEGRILAFAKIFNQKELIGEFEYITKEEYKKIASFDYMQYILGNYINLLKIYN